jgi:protein-disulfide isomerase
VRSKGATRGPRQASPRALLIGGVIVAVVVIAIVLGIVLSRNSGKTSTGNNALPTVGSHTWVGALPGASDVYNLYKGIPQTGLVLGNPNAPATLTEYIDLQCPLCRQFETEQMPTIVQKYVRPGRLNIRMEPWAILDPPGGPGDSHRGQAATIAASLQNQGFPFAQTLYNNQGTEDTGWLTTDMVGKSASSVDGLKPHQVLNDLHSSGVKSIVNQVDSSASAHNFNGTPTILLNHRGQKAQVVSVGVPNAATLQSQIESAING